MSKIRRLKQILADPTASEDQKQAARGSLDRLTQPATQPVVSVPPVHLSGHDLAAYREAVAQLDRDCSEPPEYGTEAIHAAVARLGPLAKQVWDDWGAVLLGLPRPAGMFGRAKNLFEATTGEIKEWNAQRPYEADDARHIAVRILESLAEGREYLETVKGTNEQRTIQL